MNKKLRQVFDIIACIAMLDQLEVWRENRAWLRHSRKISLDIYVAMTKQKIQLGEFAKQLGISEEEAKNWIQGKKNFTLEEISKAERILNIRIFPK